MRGGGVGGVLKGADDLKDVDRGKLFSRKILWSYGALFGAVAFVISLQLFK